MNMSASSFTVPEFTDMHYLNYGAAVSEVRVDYILIRFTVVRVGEIPHLNSGPVHLLAIGFRCDLTPNITSYQSCGWCVGPQ